MLSYISLFFIDHFFILFISKFCQFYFVKTICIVRSDCLYSIHFSVWKMRNVLYQRNPATQPIPAKHLHKNTIKKWFRLICFKFSFTPFLYSFMWLKQNEWYFPLHGFWDKFMIEYLIVYCCYSYFCCWLLNIFERVTFFLFMKYFNRTFFMKIFPGIVFAYYDKWFWASVFKVVIKKSNKYNAKLSARM